MSFLNPILLAGLAAIAVPIVLHLLNRRKFERVVWAAMRFLKSSIEQNQRRMRIEDLLLLVVRCLLLGLLAFALARPALRSTASSVFGQAKVTAVIVLDHSLSMGHSDGVASRFDQARQAAEQAVDAFPSGSSAALFLASDIARPLIPEPTYDMNLLRKMIREAPLSDRSTDMFPVFRAALATLEGRPAVRKEIYFVTDSQAHGWRQLADIQKLLGDAKRDVQTRLILVGEPAERNLGLSRLRVASGLTPVGQPLRFEVQVSNYGREEARNIPVSLSVNGDPPSDETIIDALPPGASRSISLFARLRHEGFHSVTARIPADRLPADDRRTVAVRAVKEIRVLLVDGDPGDEPRASQVFFLRHALQPVPFSELGTYFLKVGTVVPEALPATQFDDYDAVVMANVAGFPSSTVTALESYLRHGGGLVIFPGAKVNAAFYNGELLQRHQWLPASLERARGQPDGDDQYFTLQDKDYTHPMVSLWNDPGSGTLGSARFYRAFELKPAPWIAEKPGPIAAPASGKAQEAGEPRMVLRFADGTPAVMERTYGLGRVILFASTANTTWNDLPVRPAFVPLVQRAIGAVIQRQDEGLTVRVGEKFVRHVNHELLGKDAIIVKPAKDAARELCRIELVGGAPTLQYEETDFGGAYEASVTGAAGAGPAVIKFAAQPDPAESDLEELSREQLELLGESAQIIRWSPSLSLKELVLKERVGTELWLPIVLAVLLLAVVETFLAQWFSKTK